MGRCHHASFFDRVIEKRQSRRRAVRTADLKAHFLKDVCHGVADCGRRRKGEIDDAERNTETFRRFTADELSHTGNLECRSFDDVRDLRQIAVGTFRKRRAYNARTGYADVNDAVRLSHTVESTRHKRIVLGSVAEHDELRTADAVAVRRLFCGFSNHASHKRHGIHIDARLCGTDIDGRADVIRYGKRLGNRLNERAIAGRKTFVDERAVSADEVDANRPGSAFQRFGVFHGIPAAGSRQHGDGRYRDALIDDRDTVKFFDILTGFDKVLRTPRNFLVYFTAGGFNIGIGTVKKGHTHRDRADIQILLLNHGDRLHDIVYIQHGFLRDVEKSGRSAQMRCMELKISSCMTWITMPMLSPSSVIVLVSALNSTLISEISASITMTNISCKTDCVTSTILALHALHAFATFARIPTLSRPTTEITALILSAPNIQYISLFDLCGHGPTVFGTVSQIHGYCTKFLPVCQ